MTYSAFTDKFTSARDIVGVKLASCARERNRMDFYPVYYKITGRTKEYESAMKKCDCKGEPRTEEGIKRLKDIAGIRIVISYKSDLESVKADIKKHFPKATEKKLKKGSGYDATHMFVEVEVLVGDHIEKVVVEIQIVTIGMNDWSKRQHPDYKKANKKSAEGAIYRRMAEIYAELEELQEQLRELGIYYSEPVSEDSVVSYFHR